ncbi:hypothetical protein O181_074327 [Austropuccinia psidii MF-1]|uniref:CCHC-type domain-containing protein n=1 Tax=Austropuccinia psidii MF-1 TaxID=1389203 RepID=A0A9Q3IBV1_9BASI|nr:hypothetical protein [Austropuccinia psidii MF-1]
MSFENYKYSVDKDPYEWCMRQSKRLKAIDPQIKIKIRNHKLLTKVSGELEHAIKCRCNQSFTRDDMANNLEDVRKTTNIGKYSLCKSIFFKEKQPFRVEIKDKPKLKVTEVTKKRTTCHNCGTTDHYSNNCPKAKRNAYTIEQVPEEESPTEDSESDSIGEAIRVFSDDDQNPKEEC